jgi:hypothetical protein
MLMAVSCLHETLRMIAAELSAVQTQVSVFAASHMVEHHIGARVRKHLFAAFFVAVVHP